jgi:hypothetical protein
MYGRRIFLYDENNQFIIIWASTVPFRFPKEEDEDNNPRMYLFTKISKHSLKQNCF